MRNPGWTIAAVLAVAAIAGCKQAHPAGEAARSSVVRIGYFPNVTHAPALAAIERGEFARALGPGVTVELHAFNAGPEAMEALLAGALDVSYVGPNPAINTYVKSGGSALRILAGACTGGSALVARSGVAITRIEDLAGKRLAVPQLGGTQDISARRFLAERNLRPQEKGGTVQIIPTRNPDILALMKRSEIDAAWVPEPWTTRLIKEAGARLVVDERTLWPGGKPITTVVVARKRYLDANGSTVAGVLAAHIRAVNWLRANAPDAKAAVNAQLKKLTGKALPAPVLDEAWTRVDFGTEIDAAVLQEAARSAERAGYLKQGAPDVRPIIDGAALRTAHTLVGAHG